MYCMGAPHGGTTCGHHMCCMRHHIHKSWGHHIHSHRGAPHMHSWGHHIHSHGHSTYVLRCMSPPLMQEMRCRQLQLENAHLQWRLAQLAQGTGYRASGLGPLPRRSATCAPMADESAEWLAAWFPVMAAEMEAEMEAAQAGRDSGDGSARGGAATGPSGAGPCTLYPVPRLSAIGHASISSDTSLLELHEIRYACGAANSSHPTIYHFTTYHSPLATCHLPLATCHLPLATCHLPPTACR